MVYKLLFLILEHYCSVFIKKHNGNIIVFKKLYGILLMQGTLKIIIY